MIRFAPLLAALTLPVQAGHADEPPLPVPSGQLVYWQETLLDPDGIAGLTYRARFVAPQLAALFPEAAAVPDEALSPEDLAALDDLDGPEVPLEMLEDDGMVTLEDLNLAPLILPIGEGDDPEALADAEMTDHGGPVLPPAPGIIFRDPMHDDVVWLCENFVLPRIPAGGPRPAEIIISLADRPTTAGMLEPGVVQLFEVFTLPPDRDSCIWTPF
ncbi:MAG: DUF6497 family protein [Paracoccus sp. (in: a-proteobacteria)]|nr:DUF6497 family protein [Paracoccus sp. (in: a-proteobacteria)]